MARGTPRTGGNRGTGWNQVKAEDPGVGKAGGVVRSGPSAPQKAERPVPAPPAPYVPFTGAAGPRERWYPAFLADLAVNGGISLAAAAAGVHRNLVYRRIASDPEFADEVKVAEAYYRDLLEWESVNLARRKDNPLPYFARLKAELPSRYIDRQAVLLTTTDALTSEDGQALLQAMLRELTPESRRALAQSTELPPLPESGAAPAEP